MWDTWEEIGLGPTPANEPCTPVVTGSRDYLGPMYDECEKFRDLILKKFGPPPKGAVVKVKLFDHDLGPYYEVVVRFKTGPEYDDAFAYAACVERLAPTTWDDDAPVDWKGWWEQRGKDELALE